MITYKRASTTRDLKQILALQKANLPSSLSLIEQQSEGFVTVHHDYELLKRMNDYCPHIIVKDGEEVVGYALCMHPKFGNKIEVLKPMFQEIKKIVSTLPADKAALHKGPSISTYMVMGQICIDKAYRKQGLFRKLYGTMKEEIAPEFKTIITEVDRSNTRSLQAHLTIGFKTLSTYQSQGRIWELIYLK